MKSASRKLQEARRSADRWRKSARRYKSRMDAALAQGDKEKAAKAEKSLKRAKSALRSAERDITRYQPIARAIADTTRMALRLEPLAAKADERFAKERRQSTGQKPAPGGDKRPRKKALVDSPYGRVHTEKYGPDHVERVFHPIDEAPRRVRQLSLTPREKMAADRYRWAYETCPGTIRCALDTSGRGGGDAHDRSPTDDQLMAAEWLREAHALLGVVDGRAIMRVCGDGHSLTMVVNATQSSKNKGATNLAITMLSDRVRKGLAVLADHWWPERHRINGMRGDDAVPLGDPGQRAGKSGRKVIDTGVVAHVAHGFDGGDRRKKQGRS